MPEDQQNQCFPKFKYHHLPFHPNLLHKTRDLPGVALVTTFIMYGDFSAKLQQIAMLLLQAFTASNQQTLDSFPRTLGGRIKLIGTPYYPPYHKL